MGWLRLVGSLKLQLSFAEYSLFYRALLKKRLITLRSLLIEATPYDTLPRKYGWVSHVTPCWVSVCVCVCTYDLLDRVLLHMCDVTHSCVHHVTHVRDTTLSYVRHDSFVRATRLFHKCDMTCSYLRHWLFHSCRNMYIYIYICVYLYYIFMHIYIHIYIYRPMMYFIVYADWCATCHLHTCDTTHQMAGLIHMCETTYPYV